jgi:RsiW-degrading membrane proteinase PrsW (M82 family)
MTNLIDRPIPAPAEVRHESTAVNQRTRTLIASIPWRWLAVLGIGLALFAAVAVGVITTDDPILVPSLLLVGAAVVPATLTTLVTEAEASSELTLGRVLTAAVLGGVAGGVLAGVLEFATEGALGSLPYLTIGLIEESAKLAIPVALFAWGRSRGRAVDGLVLGVAAGSGFAALETAGYGFVALLQVHGQLVPVEGLLLTRALSSLGGHAAWTGLAAAAWFGIRGARKRWFGWVRFLATFAIVASLHALWDANVASGFYQWIGAFSFILLVGTALWLHRTERRREQHRHGDARRVEPTANDVARLGVSSER